MNYSYVQKLVRKWILKPFLLILVPFFLFPTDRLVQMLSFVFGVVFFGIFETGDMLLWSGCSSRHPEPLISSTDFGMP